MKPGSRREQYFGWVLLAPTFVSLFVFQYLPIGGLGIAFREFSWRSPFRGQPVGLQNVRLIFGDTGFIDAVLNTVTYASAAGLMVAALAVTVAGVFHLKSILTKRRSFSTWVMAPSFLSWVIVALLASRIFSLRGTLNAMLVYGGIVTDPVPFLSNASLFPLVFVSTTVWKHTGLMAFIVWTLLQQCSPEMRESAAIDGLGPVGAFFRIELGWLRPQLFALALLFLLLLLDGFGEQALSIGSAAVRNRADVIESYVYRVGIQRGRWAVAAAGSLVGTVVRLPVAAALLLVSLRLVRGSK